jgi:hypothetical protein
MPNKQMEDYLRDQVRQYSTPLDTDALWDAVEAQLPPKKKWRVLPIWFWMVGGVALLTGGYLLWPTTLAEGAFAATTTTTEATPVIAPASAPGPLLTDLATGAVPAFRPAAVEGTADVPVEKKSVTPLVEKPTIARPEITPVLAINIPSSPVVVAEARTLTPVTALDRSFATEVASLAPSPTLFAPAAAPTVLKAVAARKAGKEQKELAEKGEKLRKKESAYWSAEFGLAASLVSKDANASGDGGNGGQATINNNNERGLEGITLQGLIGYHRPAGLSLRSGLLFSRINTRIRTDVTTTATTGEEGVVAILVQSDGRRIEQRGTVEVTTEETSSATYYNSVSSLDVPILLGYRFATGGFGLMVEGGPTISLSSGGAAKLYDGVNDFRVASDNHFLGRRTGLGFMFNLTGEYRLGEKAALIGGLRLQGFGGRFEDVAVAGYATTYMLVGVQVGYRVRF